MKIIKEVPNKLSESTDLVENVGTQEEIRRHHVGKDRNSWSGRRPRSRKKMFKNRYIVYYFHSTFEFREFSLIFFLSRWIYYGKKYL